MLFFTGKNAFDLRSIFVTNIKFILQDAANAKIKVSRLFFSPILPHTHADTHKLHGKRNLVSEG
jgi:hypothetical protein